MSARIGGLLLLVTAGLSAWFAWGPDYTLLMNPDFRWVTQAGSVLLALLALGELLAPHHGSRSAAVIFAAFLLMVVIARPDEGGIAPLLAPPMDGPPVEREGYAPLRGEDLFEGLEQEATDLPTTPIVMRGFVKRLPKLDARGEFILLEPRMACCLADAIAMGVRVAAPDRALPEERTWIHVFGRLTPIDPPRAVPKFRVGAILFTAVSRTHRLVADEVVGFTALLPPLLERIPPERCSIFLRLVQAAGMESLLQGDEPYTVFAPLDAAFESGLTPAELNALLADPVEARAVVSDWTVRGRFKKRALFGGEAGPPHLTSLLRDQHLPVEAANGRLVVGGARVLFGDQVARNGVVHLVHPLPASDP